MTCGRAGCPHVVGQQCRGDEQQARVDEVLSPVDPPGLAFEHDPQVVVEHGHQDEQDADP